MNYYEKEANLRGMFKAIGKQETIGEVTSCILKWINNLVWWVFLDPDGQIYGLTDIRTD